MSIKAGVLCQQVFPSIKSQTVCGITNASFKMDDLCRQMFDSIKSQTMSIGSTKEELFDQNGNGNIGFSIYNIQRQGEGYVYKLVSSNTPLLLFVCLVAS